MRLTSLFLFIALMRFGAAADDTVFNYPLRRDGQEQFLARCREFAAHPLVRGDFTQTKNIARLNRALVSSGNFIIAASRGIGWRTVSPFPSLLALKKDGITQTLNGETQNFTATDNAVFARFAAIFTAVFAGNAPQLLADFTVYFHQTAGGDWALGLIPRDKTIASVITKIELDGAATIDTVKWFEPNGDTVQYVFSALTFPETLTDEEKFGSSH